MCSGYSAVFLCMLCAWLARLLDLLQIDCSALCEAQHSGHSTCPALSPPAVLSRLPPCLQAVRHAPSRHDASAPLRHAATRPLRPPRHAAALRNAAPGHAAPRHAAPGLRVRFHDFFLHPLLAPLGCLGCLGCCCQRIGLHHAETFGHPSHERSAPAAAAHRLPVHSYPTLQTCPMQARHAASRRPRRSPRRRTAVPRRRCRRRAPARRRCPLPSRRQRCARGCSGCQAGWSNCGWPDLDG